VNNCNKDVCKIYRLLKIVEMGVIVFFIAYKMLYFRSTEHKKHVTTKRKDE